MRYPAAVNVSAVIGELGRPYATDYPGGAVNVRAEARSHERFPNRSPEALAHRIPTEDRDRRSGQSSSDLSDHYLFGSWPDCAGRTNCRNTELSGRHVLGSVVPWLTLGCSSN